MLRRTSVWGTLLVVAPFAIAACSSDDPAAPDPNPPPPARVILAAPSFATNIVEIFNRTGCSSGNCHGNGAAGLTLSTAAVSFANLVNIASSFCGGETRVIPNDATNSYLMKKVLGTQACGARMPLGGGQLDATDIGNLTNWINTGAPNN